MSGVETAPSTAAERMRRSRARRSRGDLIVIFVVASDVIEKLIRHPCLDAADRADNEMIIDAVIRLAERALALRTNMQCDAQRAKIEE